MGAILADAGVPLSTGQIEAFAEKMLTTLGPNPDASDYQPVDDTGLRDVGKQLLAILSEFMTREQVDILKSRYIDDNKFRSIMKDYPKNSGITLP